MTDHMTTCRDCGKQFQIQPLLDLPQPTRCMECLIGLEAEVARLRAALEEIADICDCDRETPDGYGGDGHWRSCHTKADRGSCLARRALAEKGEDR